MKSEPKDDSAPVTPDVGNPVEPPSDHFEKRSQSEADYEYFTKLAEENGALSPTHTALSQDGRTLSAAPPSSRSVGTDFPASGEQPKHLVDPGEESLTVSDIWAAALLPQTSAYVEILRDPNASRGRAYAWMAIAGAATYGFSMVIQILFGFLAFQWPGAAGTNPAHLTLGLEVSVGIILAGLPVSAAAAVITLVILASLYRFIASTLGGSGTYPMMVYAMASYLAPLSITSGIIAAIPYVNVLLIPLLLYAAALTLTAVRTVNRLNWWKASLVVFIFPNLAGAGLAALIAAALRYLAPSSLSAAFIGLYTSILQQFQLLIP
jgi:hypothetical protein